MNTPAPFMGMTQTEYAAEQRLQKLEEVSVQFAAHTAAEEYRFEMISNQIADLSKAMETLSRTMTEKMADIAAKVEDLKKQQDEHHQFLVTLQTEQTKTKERKKLVIKGVLWGLAAAIGAFLAKFGEAIYKALGGT